MSKQLDLGAFLEKQSAVGTKDSEGRFTVAHGNAARKLAKFALPRDCAWVTKLIQAANAWQVPEVLIVQSRNETQFQLRFLDTGRLPSEEEVVSSMLNATIGSAGPLENFGAALRSLVEQARLSFVLVVDNGLDRPKPVYAGEHYGKISEAQRFSSRFRPQVGINLTIHHVRSQRIESVSDLLHRPSQSRAIIDELETFCYLSPVPITLNGTELTGVLQGRSTQPSPSLRPLMVGACAGKESELELLELPGNFQAGTIDLLDGTLTPKPCLPDLSECSSAFTVMVKIPSGTEKGLSFQDERSSLRWCRQGVIVESQRLSIKTYGLSLSIYLSAEGLQTDLTGFQLAHSDEKERREQRALQECSKKLSESMVGLVPIASLEYHLEPNAEELREQNLSRVKLIAASVAAGGITSLAIPFVGVTVILGGLATAWFVDPVIRSQNVLSHRRTLEETVTLDLKTFIRSMGHSEIGNGGGSTGPAHFKHERADTEYRNLARELAEWRESKDEPVVEG